MHFFYTCVGTNVDERLDVHARTLHVLIREDNLDIKAWAQEVGDRGHASSPESDTLLTGLLALALLCRERELVHTDGGAFANCFYVLKSLVVIGICLKHLRISAAGQIPNPCESAVDQDVSPSFPAWAQQTKADL